MGFRTLRFLSVSTLFLSPVAAQFGIPMRMKKGSSFQDLENQAKDEGKKDVGGLAGLGDMDMDAMAKMFEGVDMGQMQEMWKNALNDPETMKQLEGMGDKFGEAMEELSKMTPEQLQSQMTEAMSMLTDGEMADTIVAKKDEVLASLEQTGMVSPEELAKFKADPEYFEQKMRESFSQMKDVFGDPEMIKGAMQAMQGGGEEQMKQMAKLFSEELDTDEKIEQARIEVMSNPEIMENPMLKTMFQTDEFKEVITDPKKWRESIKEGQKAFAGFGADEAIGQGAGVGEL